MTIDPLAEVRDAVRPSAAAGQLSDVQRRRIADRHRVPLADVERIYREEHARLHPETAKAAPATKTSDDATSIAAAREAVAAIAAKYDRGPVAAAARRATASLARLQQVAEADAANAALREKRARLTAQLAALDAQLSPTDQCECGHVGAARGMAIHRAKSATHAEWVAAQGGDS